MSFFLNKTFFPLDKGGSGRRKLTVIPPEAEGYSVKALQAVSAGGKATFYIVPLQETLDTSPLPPDSHQFSKMPKMTCHQCNEVMPLQMLAVHVKTCKEIERKKKFEVKYKMSIEMTVCTSAVL